MTPGRKKKQTLSITGGVRTAKVQEIPGGLCAAAELRHAFGRGGWGASSEAAACADTKQLGAAPLPAARARPGTETRQAPSCSVGGTHCLALSSATWFMSSGVNLLHHG